MSTWQRLKTKMMTRDDYQLTDNDHAALQLALDLTLADDPRDEGRAEQVTDFLNEPRKYGRRWLETAKFCAYHQQTARLKTYPWQRPPCWIVTKEEADLILEEGPFAAMNSSDPDISDCKLARLLKEMLAHGVSAFHPNPIAAIEEARRKVKQS